MPDTLLPLHIVAKRLSIALPTIRAWVWQHKIEFVRIGGCVRIRESVVEHLIKKGTVPEKQ